jgi:hypothetical protein
MTSFGLSFAEPQRPPPTKPAVAAKTVGYSRDLPGA